jgi:hypothetical protein
LQNLEHEAVSSLFDLCGSNTSGRASFP